MTTFSHATPTSSIDGSSSASTGSLDSDPTTLESSSSPETEHSQPTTPPADSGKSSIQYEHRVFVTGPTGSGKSRLARGLLLSAAAPRLVIDPSDSSIFGDVVGREGTFSDPHRVPDTATARFVPNDPQDRDAYDALYRWISRSGPRYVVLDEAGVAAPANGSPPGVRTVVIQGRKKSIGHVACHTRPREVDKNLIAQAAHVFVFGCNDPDDRRHLAQQMELPVDLLAGELAALERFEFLWWDRTARTLTACPPLAAT